MNAATETTTPAAALTALRASIKAAPFSGSSDGEMGTWCTVRTMDTADKIERLAKLAGCDVTRTRFTRKWCSYSPVRSQAIKLLIIAPTAAADTYLGGGCTRVQLRKWTGV